MTTLTAHQMAQRNQAIHDAIRLITKGLPMGWYMAGSAKDQMIRIMLYLRTQEFTGMDMADAFGRRLY